MKFLEKDLEQIIMSASNEMLRKRGLHVYGTRKNQVRIGNYGIADIIELQRPSWDNDMKIYHKGVINVIELKKENISVSSFFQAINYLHGIKRFIEIKKPHLQHLFNYRITLIGKNIDSNSSICYLPDIIDSNTDCIHEDNENKLAMDIFTYDYTLNGLEFKSEYGYKLKNEGF
jgi:hypothetical protein